jgi:hypothetical protein
MKNAPRFGLIPAILWLSLAVVTDLLSLIPYLGLLFSWPFAGLFFIYKYLKGFGAVRIGFTTLTDFVGEGLLSSLPMNTLDVLLTYSMVEVMSQTPGGELVATSLSSKLPVK